MKKDKKGVDGGTASTEGGRKRSPAAATDAVGRKLKASYGELLREPIPDKFIQLLQQLDDGEAETAADATDKSTFGKSTAGKSSDGKTDEKQAGLAGGTQPAKKDEI